MGNLLRRLRVLVRRRRFEAELEEELRFHREQTTAAPAAGRRLALEASRDVWIWPWLQDAAHDVRLAARGLARERRFTILAVLVLGTGIGVNNMLFTILNAHTIRGLPIDRADRVLYVSTVDADGRRRGISYPDFAHIRASAQSFAGVAAFVNAPVTVGDEGRAPERIDGAYLTADVFGVVGVRSVVGRAFTADDDRPGAARVALLSEGVWQSRYGRQPDIVGQSIRVNGAATTVIGIVPERSGLPRTTQVWLPLSMNPGLDRERRDTGTLEVFGRLRDGVDPEAARAEVEGITAQLTREYPDANRTFRARVVLINEQFLGRPSDPAWRAFITVAFLVLTISCANVANLFLNRSRERTREIAIRTALGASRARVVRQLMIEASVLALVGALVGLAVAIAGVRVFRGLIPDNVLPYWLEYSIDARVLAMLVGVTAATVLVFGLIPAIIGSKTDVNRALKDTREIGSRVTRRWTAVFLTSEFALAVVMLAHIVLGLRVAGPALPSDAAVDTPEVLTAMLTLPGDRYPTPAQRGDFFARVEERLRAVSFVSAATFASAVPRGGGQARGIAVAGRERGDVDEPVTMVAIGPGYFQLFQLPMQRGREFVDRDGAAGQPHAIINERAARLYFEDEDPIGQRIAVRSPGADAAPEWLTIVGVAPDVQQRPGPRPGGAAQSDPVVYLPYRANPPATAALLLRTDADSGTVATAVRDLLLTIDPTIPLYRVRTMAGLLDDAGWNGRVSNLLIRVLAFIAVALATIGLYAVTAHGVNQRTAELGLRMALGARRVDLAGLILRRVLMQVGVGFAAGVVCTLLWGRLFPSELPDVTLAAGESLAAIAAILLLLTSLASLVPVYRATRLDPAAALRYE